MEWENPNVEPSKVTLQTERWGDFHCGWVFLLGSFLINAVAQGTYLKPSSRLFSLTLSYDEMQRGVHVKYCATDCQAKEMQWNAATLYINEEWVKHFLYLMENYVSVIFKDIK